MNATTRNEMPRTLALTVALSVLVGACSGGGGAATTTSMAPVPSSVVAVTTTTSVAPTTTATSVALTTTTTTTQPPAPPVTTVFDPETLDPSEPCSVYAAFRYFVGIDDFESAYVLVHSYSKNQPPLGLDTGVDRFPDSSDAAFETYADSVAGAPYGECRYISFGESFGQSIGALELTQPGARSVPVRTEDGSWRIDELTEHVTSVTPPSGSVQPSFARTEFRTPLGTFDLRMQVDGVDVYDFAVVESPSDPEQLSVTFAPRAGFGSGDHIVTLITVLENGLVDADSLFWTVP